MRWVVGLGLFACSACLQGPLATEDTASGRSPSGSQSGHTGTVSAPGTTPSLTAYTGTTGDTGEVVEPENLLVNGDFESDGGWSLRQGYEAFYVTPPGRKGTALFIDDIGPDVSWWWSDPVLVTEGEVLCVRGDTYKRFTTGGAYPRVFMRFYRTKVADIHDRVLSNANGDPADIETYKDNRDAKEGVWASIEEPFEVPAGVGVVSVRVFLAGNSTPTGELYFDDMVLHRGTCVP